VHGNTHRRSRNKENKKKLSRSNEHRYGKVETFRGSRFLESGLGLEHTNDRPYGGEKERQIPREISHSKEARKKKGTFGEDGTRSSILLAEKNIMRGILNPQDEGKETAYAGVRVEGINFLSKI